MVKQYPLAVDVVAERAAAPAQAEGVIDLSERN